MGVCAVFGCSNHTSSMRRKGIRIHFYRFPRDKALCEQWVEACRRADEINTNTGLVCWEHFQESDYKNFLEYRMMKTKLYLKPTAVPSLKLPAMQIIPKTKRKEVHEREKKTKRKVARCIQIPEKQLHRKWKEENIIKKLEKRKKKECSESTEEKESTSEGRQYTISIAVPGSILDNAQTVELQTYVAGQIARAATIFNVDEVIVFDETGSVTDSGKKMELLLVGDKGYCNLQLSRILQYLECPQYLRKDLILLHPDLKFAGLLNPLNAPHHLSAKDVSQYREGVVVKRPVKEGKGSYVKVGLSKEVQIDKALEAGTRVTVRLEPGEKATRHLKGVAVPPSAPRTDAGLYWGYTVRLASCLLRVVTECPFKDGYDLVIGTSEKGDNIDDTVLPLFKHLLIVFGGVNGLEASLEAEESLSIEDPRCLFPYYLNTCPGQGSRTIRTEEAVFITLSTLRPKILQCQKRKQFLLFYQH